MDGSAFLQSGAAHAVVALPARDEADWIESCILALDRQQGARPNRVVVLVNNSTDATASLIHGLRPALAMPVDVIEHQFAPEQSNAGHARRMAMDVAADCMAGGGVLLCTDADGQVAPDWLAMNLFHIRQGADAVAGCAVLDPLDAAAIPPALHEDDARECAYAALLDEIDSLLDPCPFDPWPRHAEHAGASIAVTTEAFHRAGGIPPHVGGEDRAFFAALRRIDARIKHALDVRVTVSGRIQGRAAGGMADTIRRRLVAPDLYLDDALEPAANRARRAWLRRRARHAYEGQAAAGGRDEGRQGRLLRQAAAGPGADACGTRLHAAVPTQDAVLRVPSSWLRRTPAGLAQLAVELGCPATALAEALACDSFGRAWERIEAEAATLARSAVPVAFLAQQTAAAREILIRLQEYDRGFLERGVNPVPAAPLS